MKPLNSVPEVPAQVLGARSYEGQEENMEIPIPLPDTEPFYGNILDQRKSLGSILPSQTPPLRAPLFSSFSAPPRTPY